MLSILLFILGLQPLHEAGYRGEGITIAVIDEGFYGADNADVFDQSHILGAYDLLPDSLRRADLFSDPDCSHGTICLSTMLCDMAELTGTAPDADYYLIRTEDKYHERHAEVENLIRGMQLADELQADIISISLGYFRFDNPADNYTYADMNGLSTVSQAADELARRGHLVCVAVGNGGNQDWHYMYLPADAHDVLTVGATDADGNCAPFSSWGPTADGRIKPEVCAWGQMTPLYQPALLTEEGGIAAAVQPGNGTSFACPEVAGMAACLWQAMPELSAAELRDLIIRSADHYDQPDNQRGYGVPDAGRALQLATATHLPAAKDTSRARKQLRNGQITIIRHDAAYTILGQKKE